jgi:hypothetical protein
MSGWSVAMPKWFLNDAIGILNCTFFFFHCHLRFKLAEDAMKDFWKRCLETTRKGKTIKINVIKENYEIIEKYPLIAPLAIIVMSIVKRQIYKGSLEPFVKKLLFLDDHNRYWSFCVNVISCCERMWLLTLKN